MALSAILFLICSSAGPRGLAVKGGKGPKGPQAIVNTFKTTLQEKLHCQWGLSFLTLYHGCADGDICSFTIHGVHPLLGHRIAIRLAGIDTPEMHGKCEEEKALAPEAKMFMESLLGQAQDIHLVGAKRGKHFRIVATVEADGQDVSDLLIQEGLAVVYDGGVKEKDWCA